MQVAGRRIGLGRRPVAGARAALNGHPLHGGLGNACRERENG